MRTKDEIIDELYIIYNDKEFSRALIKNAMDTYAQHKVEAQDNYISRLLKRIDELQKEIWDLKDLINKK